MDKVHADIFVFINQCLQRFRGHAQDIYLRICLHTDGERGVFGKDKGWGNEVTRAQPAHFYLLSAERNHATDEASADDNVGKPAGHTRQSIDISLVIANDLIGNIAQSQLYAELVHAGK